MQRNNGDLTAPTRGRAAQAVIGTIARGAGAYQRERDLPRLIPLGPHLIGCEPDPESQTRIVSLLARAIRQERNRGRAGHWCYDLNRHIALAQALRAETWMLTRQLKKNAARRAALKT